MQINAAERNKCMIVVYFEQSRPSSVDLEHDYVVDEQLIRNDRPR